MTDNKTKNPEIADNKTTSRDIEIAARYAILYLVSNTINGKYIEGLFTTAEKAEQYIFRLATNFKISSWHDDPDTFANEKGDPVRFVQEFVADEYQLEHVSCVNSASPMYVNVLRNGNVYGNTHHQYLSNNPMAWCPYEQNDNDLNYTRWKNSRTVVPIDPPLPPLLSFAELQT